MTNLIVRALEALCAFLFPATGVRRAPAPTPATAPTSQRRRRPLPTHKSPYAHEAAAGRTFVDTLSPVRPYVLARPDERPDDPEERAQAYRRWALDMAVRGFDVGPSVIHGVHVSPGSRTLCVAVA